MPEEGGASAPRAGLEVTRRQKEGHAFLGVSFLSVPRRELEDSGEERESHAQFYHLGLARGGEWQ